MQIPAPDPVGKKIPTWPLNHKQTFFKAGLDSAQELHSSLGEMLERPMCMGKHTGNIHDKGKIHLISHTLYHRKYTIYNSMAHPAEYVFLLYINDHDYKVPLPGHLSPAQRPTLLIHVSGIA